MFLTRISSSAASLAYCLAVLGVTATILVLINSNTDSATVAAQSGQGPVVESPSAVFPGTGVGAIPDPGAFTSCGAGGAAPLNISFAVSGMSAPLTDVQVSFTATHTFVGDLVVTLLAPGGAPNGLIFGRTGGTGTATTCGSGSDLNTTYSFFDTAPATPTWWTAAATTPIPTGNYRTSTLGSVAGGGANTTLTPAFTGLSTAQINGTWTLQVQDVTGTDTGSVSSANLTLTGGAATPTPPDALADFDADGKTDYTVIRSAPGISGQATWYVSLNATSVPFSRDWGVASDTFVPADFDGDGKDDVAVWRPGVQGTFYIIQSATNTLFADDFGVSGDDASVVGDYNNDGKDDLAVYRSGATPGSLSFWFWKSGGVFHPVQWGVNGDFVAPGDYNGDGGMDYAIQRNNGSASDYYIRYNGGGPDTLTTFGQANDIVVPGDYDGDLKTDLAAIRPNGSQWQWDFKKSSDGTTVSNTWGLIASDYPAPGDYNGDGKADYAVWRFGALSTFYVMTSGTFQISSRQWGFVDDIPATLTYTH